MEIRGLYKLLEEFRCAAVDLVHGIQLLDKRPRIGRGGIAALGPGLGPPRDLQVVMLGVCSSHPEFHLNPMWTCLFSNGTTFKSYADLFLISISLLF